MRNINEKNQLMLEEHPPLIIKPCLRDFSYWIAGLIDADGYIDKSGYIIICFNERDMLVANYIRTIIGAGTILHTKSSHSCQYRARCKKSILFLCQLIRNKLRNPKRIDQWNSRSVPRFGIPNTQNHYVGVKANNAWLAGFIQGDGSFQIQINDRSKWNLKSQIIVVVQVSQKSDFLLHQIKKTFGGLIYYDSPKDCHIYSTSNQSNAKTIIQYLDVYQLIGVSFVVYKIWRRAACYLLNKTPRNLDKLYRIKHLKKTLSRVKKNLNGLKTNEHTSLSRMR